MPLKRLRFNRVLLIIGSLLGLAVVGDLIGRGLARRPVDPIWEIRGGDPVRGQQIFLAHGCGSCHQIRQVQGAIGRVGPRLEGLREQTYLAGVLTNQPSNLISWIQNPQKIDPLTAMPDVGVTEAEARDIAAFLYTLP